VWTKLGILNGAATPDGKQPTSLWWVYKSYSDATGILYDVTETKDIRAIAAVDRKASSTRVLIGNQSEEELPVNLVLQDLSKAGFGPKAVVRRRLIPNTSEKALEAPQAPEDLSVSAENDILKVDVGVLPGYGAMEVILLGEEAK